MVLLGKLPLRYLLQPAVSFYATYSFVLRNLQFRFTQPAVSFYATSSCGAGFVLQAFCTRARTPVMLSAKMTEIHPSLAQFIAWSTATSSLSIIVIFLSG